MPRIIRSLPERIHFRAYGELAASMYGKSRSSESESYERGRVSALRWLCELSSYYMDMEKRVSEEMLYRIEKEMEKISMMSENEYRKGIEDSVKMVLAEATECRGR